MTANLNCLRTLVASAGAAVTLAACGKPEVPPVVRPTQVETATVQYSEAARSVSQTGEIRARLQTDLAFRVSGRISERKVDVGAHVAPGQVLARIEPQEYSTTAAGAEAAVRAAEANLQQATSSRDRQRALKARGSTTQLELDQAEEAFKTAQGTVAAAKAQMATTREVVTQTVLKATVAGVITARLAEVGEVVQAAQAVFTIAHDGPRDAVFNLHESVFIDEPIDRAREIDVVLLADPTVRAVGKIREVAPKVDAKSGTVLVKIGLEHVPERMILGAAVTAGGSLTARRAVILPASALNSANGSPAVWVIDPKTSSATLRPIQIERYETANIVVRSGLAPGEQVVTAGAQLLRPQQVVSVPKGSAQ